MHRFITRTRHYEDEANWDATIDDLDKKLLHEYKLRIGAEDLSDEQVLKLCRSILNLLGRKGIYSDMKNFFLDEPLNKETNQSLKLIFKSNIVMRHVRQKLHSVENLGISTWDSLDSIEQALLTYMINRGPASRSELSNYTKKTEEINRKGEVLRKPNQEKAKTKRRKTVSKSLE